MGQIEIVGEASISVKPDEIKLKIVIEEYLDKSNNIIPIKTIEEEFRNCLKNKIKSKHIKLIKLFSSGGYNPFKDVKDIVLKSKIVKIKVKKKNFKLIESVITDLQTIKGLTDISIGDLKCIDYDNLKKESKIQAIKNGKKEAHYLLDAIDLKLGHLISVSNGLSIRNNFMINSNRVNSVNQNKELNMQPIKVDFGKIQISASVNLTFNIKN